MKTHSKAAASRTAKPRAGRTVKVTPAGAEGMYSVVVGTYKVGNHPESAAVSSREAAKLLREHMGRQLFSRTLGVEPTSADRYLRGSTPKHDVEQRIIDAYTAWQEVSKVEAPETVRAWFMGMKDALGDLSPSEAIAQDRGRDVMAVARAYVQSA